ncbi:GntR family transcriptional regulator [Vibrio neptunius]|uniref:GntR family transcriptional regulator n=1 Tax=Vibrio neptunius TaxID=170651 RepID=A0ABS2ZZ40_9VIBR|nr:GntR family transcriptional regulator [Vibrio neptunius]MBN3514013.1 GntR family transcriptional regulator [Vibrio neptunius]MBN3548354.1 GntR family transcriptional regulator [Vibrio neptunius]MBN3576059.1 GntR family transcriptional regulator [Vibrio neptunius]MCH9869723.1 GntR family transcriptional regulator [Vibrio neptunius]
MSSPTLTNKVSKMIYQDILSGELKPSQKLVVADLKTRYHVGASPIREALVQLSWTKYVSLEPQKGCWVSQVSVDELADLYESLRTVAAVLLKKSILSGSEDWELEVLTSFHKLSRIDLPNDDYDWKEWEERLHQFHITLLEGSNSRNMFEFFTDLINQIKRYRYFARNNGLDTRRFEIDECENIMKLALAKDTEQATKQFDRHLHRSMEQIQTTIEQDV